MVVVVYDSSNNFASFHVKENVEVSIKSVNDTAIVKLVFDNGKYQCELFYYGLVDFINFSMAELDRLADLLSEDNVDLNAYIFSMHCDTLITNGIYEITE